MAALEARHLSELTFSELSRAVRALSSTYVERRARLGTASAFDTAGKRAAYAVYYNVLHFVTLSHVVRSLAADHRRITHLLDLGCGGGAAGAAWATQCVTPPRVTGVDAHPWAVSEASFTYRHFGLTGSARRANLSQVRIPRAVDAIVAGWAVNELTEPTRASVRAGLVQAASRGAAVLIVEPIATRVSPWWAEWQETFEALGGRSNEWRFSAGLPSLVERLDRAAGLRHDELTARSLFVPPREQRPLERGTTGTSP